MKVRPRENLQAVSHTHFSVLYLVVVVAMVAVVAVLEDFQFA